MAGVAVYLPARAGPFIGKKPPEVENALRGVALLHVQAELRNATPLAVPPSAVRAEAAAMATGTL